MSTSKIRVEVCDAHYVIASTDPEDYVLSLGEKLDKDVREIMRCTPSASVTTAVVVVALGYLDEAKKSTASTDNMRMQIKEYLEDASGATMAAEEAHREIERLRREIGYLKENRLG